MTTLDQERACPACGSEGYPLPEYRRVGLARCVHCDLVFLGKRGPYGVERLYASDEYTNVHSKPFDESRAFRFIAERRVTWITHEASPGKLLELGPGRGFFMDGMREVGCEVVGIEPSPALAARATAEFDVPIHCGFLDEVDLPSRHFDLACMFHVLEHVEDPVSTLQLLRHLLKPNGLLFVEVPNFASAMARRRRDQWEAVQPAELHVSQFTPETLGQVVGRAGFKVVRLETVAPWHYLRPARRVRPRPLMGYGYRASRIGTLRTIHPCGFDNLRILASPSGH